MNRLIGLLLLAALTLHAASAECWTFEQAIDVSNALPNGVFQHLDASGRRSIAASEHGIGVVWEDDRDGTPRVYFAYKDFSARRFGQAQRISGDGEAYEPGLVALSGQRFALVWEEHGGVWLRLLSIPGETQLGAVQRIGLGESAQASVVADADRLRVLRSEREGSYTRIRLQTLQTNGLIASQQSDCPVDAEAPTDDQLYPTAALVQGRLVVAWEDRRPKHTIIMAATQQAPGMCRFTPPLRISEKPPGGNMPYGTGHGVSRVALDRIGKAGAFAAWADKRSFRNGYDIWGAHYRPETSGFGQNVRVQDDFGGLAKQRHVTVAGHPDGTLVVAWDDDREGNTDLMLSAFEDEGFSDDVPIPVASGAGEQTHPAMTFDQEGNLHLIWLERARIGAPSRIRYALGKR